MEENIIPAGTLVYIENKVISAITDSVDKESLDKAMHTLYGVYFRETKSTVIGNAITHIYYSHTPNKIYEFGDKVSYEGTESLFLEYISEFKHEAWIIVKGGARPIRVYMDEILPYEKEE